ncbi:MAG TPA: hypothetical protein VFT01_02370 [Homoserinimonas sp.]|nr:hypothetical protein [Homoserinimonas sp.]
MRRLYYAGGNMLMADSTCKAVLRYARALADANKADVVMLPVVTEGGSLAYAHMLIGPASQLFSTPVEKSQDEPVDAEAVAELETRTLKLQPTRPTWPSEMTDVADLRDLDLGLDYPDLDTGQGHA